MVPRCWGGVGFQGPGFQLSYGRFPAFLLRFLAFGTRFSTPNLNFLDSGIRFPGCGIQHSDSGLDFPASEAKLKDFCRFCKPFSHRFFIKFTILSYLARTTEMLIYKASGWVRHLSEPHVFHVKSHQKLSFSTVHVWRPLFLTFRMQHVVSWTPFAPS